MKALVIYLFILLSTLANVDKAVGTKLCFPKNFMFGVATAAYQIEGAWNSSGKGESIWDHYTHSHPDEIFDHSNADVTANSYQQFAEDARLVKNISAKFYRFSISWPRVLPNGMNNAVNQDGIRYYHALIDELLKRDIYPLVTIYHWDLPQYLQTLGGWTNPIIVDYFVDYAKLLFDNFGDKVKTWITFNEPLSFCGNGYGGSEAPGSKASGIMDYMCGHNVLKAHARVYRMYREEYFRKQSGSVGITLDMNWAEPNTTSVEDQEAAETARQFLFGWFAHPIFSKEGDYPAVMRQRVDEMSRKQNYPRSRLPTFTAEEVDYIRGTYDFLGLNHYTSQMTKHNQNEDDNRPRVASKASFYDDMGVKQWQKQEWPKTNSTWLRVVPWGFRKCLHWVKDSYGNPPVVVTENGVSFGPGLTDHKRIQFMDGYLRSMYDAMTIDKCDVLAYTYWSLIDNFEWLRGFSERFGLFEVDYSSEERHRTPRLSAKYFQELATTKCLPSLDDYM